MSPRNILIFHQGALGDFVLNWPLAMALSRLYPQSRVRYVTQGRKGELAAKLLGVERLDVERGWHHLHGDAEALPPEAKAALAGAHQIYSFVADAGDRWSANVRRMALRSDVVCLRPTPPADFAGHATDYLVGQLAHRKMVQDGVRQMVAAIGRGALAKARLAQSGVALHPGSGSPGKCWPGFLELARLLRDRGAAVRVVLGEVELERWPAPQVAAYAAVAEICRPASYLELAACLANSSAYVGNDSGPSHLAGVMGLRATCIFGPTRPEIWRPLGPNVRVLGPFEAVRAADLAQSIAAGA